MASKGSSRRSVPGDAVRLQGQAVDQGVTDQVLFLAGTPLRTPEGSKPIEAFVMGDRILTRNEHDPSAPLTVGVVMQTFIRVSRIQNVLVEGRILETTPEHPFWVDGKGWIPSAELQEGDRLQTSLGYWLTCGGSVDSGKVLTVYNLEVAGDHTYFVGANDWGFDVWVHNAKKYTPDYNREAAEALLKKVQTDSKVKLNGTGGSGKVYLMDADRLESGKPYVGSTKRDVGTGVRGKDRFEDLDHRTKTTDKKAPTGRVIADDLTADEKLGIEGLLVHVGGDKLSNGQKAIRIDHPKNEGRVKAGNDLIVEWFQSQDI